ncbi:MAG: RibD family protein [Methylibium sp.]|uniref:RibD family protein n=1 Tax=Methylibium sp. TaxID=2067992 RepID=UPI00181FC579|nr:RibD family protein [Methylibium sp.]MBA3598427.1 RibD family protein [Methylibium sp.]
MDLSRIHPSDEAAVWPLCLAIVQCRRSGGWPTAPGRYALVTDPAPAASRPAALLSSAAPDAPLAWSAQDGWSLCGEHDACTLEFFALYKPLLDRPPGSAPWVIAQLGQSLDGFVATHRGHSCFVTGPQSLVHLHRLRALCDAVIVGAGTVAADDPRLTTRHVEGAHPVRVVLDPHQGLDGAARVFSDGEAPTLRLCRVDATAGDVASPGNEEVLGVPGLLDANGALDARAVVAALQARGLSLLFVEGGGITVSRFLAQSCLDRLHLTVAPVLIGAGRRGLQVAAADTMDECLRPHARALRLGDDVLWDIDLRHPAPPLTAPR